MERKLTFDDIPELYDSARPGYPEELVKDIIRISKIPEGGDILEIGCGTGKATMPFARRGYKMVSVDIGRRMIDFVSKKFSEYPNVGFELSSFEEWDDRQRKFDLVISATAFHWVNPEIGYAKIANILKDDGYMALFWTNHIIPKTKVYDEIEKLYARITPEFSLDPSTDIVAERMSQIDSAGFFEPTEVARYPFEIEYSTDEFIATMSTHSTHMVMEEEKRRMLFDGFRKVVDSNGGKITKSYESALFIAKKR